MAWASERRRGPLRPVPAAHTHFGDGSDGEVHITPPRTGSGRGVWALPATGGVKGIAIEGVSEGSCRDLGGLDAEDTRKPRGASEPGPRIPHSRRTKHSGRLQSTTRQRVLGASLDSLATDSQAARRY